MKPASIPLGELAVARSGDKGNHANIGVIARDPDDYQHLQDVLTEEAVAEFFRAWGLTRVRRYLLPKVHAFNFVLENVLDGGAGESLRIDTQGKLLGSVMEMLPIPPPVSR